MPAIKIGDDTSGRLEALAKLTRRSVPEVIDTLSHADMGIMLECEAARAVAARAVAAQPKGGKGE